jgi:hypothetical protein
MPAIEINIDHTGALYKHTKLLLLLNLLLTIEDVSDRNSECIFYNDRLCGLVVRVPGYRSRGPGSISGATRFTEE